MGDKNGIVSKGEWLAYVKRLADNNGQSAAAVLALYRNHLSNSSNTAEAYGAAKNAMDVLVDDSTAQAPQCWWACYWFSGIVDCIYSAGRMLCWSLRIIYLLHFAATRCGSAPVGMSTQYGLLHNTAIVR